MKKKLTEVIQRIDKLEESVEYLLNKTTYEIVNRESETISSEHQNSNNYSDNKTLCDPIISSFPVVNKELHSIYHERIKENLEEAIEHRTDNSLRKDEDRNITNAEVEATINDMAKKVGDLSNQKLYKHVKNLLYGNEPITAETILFLEDYTEIDRDDILGAVRRKSDNAYNSLIKITDRNKEIERDITQILNTFVEILANKDEEWSMPPELKKNIYNCLSRYNS